jgi:endonuclease-3
MDGKASRARRAKRSVVPGVTGKSVAKLLRVLAKQAPKWNAPIVALAAQQNQSPFLTLIGCILSLRTKDQMTAVACEKLFAKARTPEAILALPSKTLEKLIYPVGFYRTKVKVIRGICTDLIEKFDGRVPDKIDDLLTLNGVGRKTANLVVTQAFRKPGICVDTHVHRISNRWGLVASKSPDKTEIALREVLPRRHWIDYNTILVAFGQTLCQPVSPWCSRCPIQTECPRIGIVHSR